MSESERRRKYRYNRVLIETERVLDPQFADAVVFLSGGQIEMLRNATQYLNRLDTYVSEQFLGYYLAPTAEDYDTILSIVADLEESLMGNPNTIFGYKDTYGWEDHSTVSGAGDKTIYGHTVPASECWRIEALSARNEDTACDRIEVFAYKSGGDVTVHRHDNPAINELVMWQGMLTLEAGNTLYFVFDGCQDGDYIRAEMRGYIMEVPA